MMRQLSTGYAASPVAVRLAVIVAAVLLLASCGKAPADAAPAASPGTTSSLVQTTAGTDAETSAAATPQPSQTAISSAIAPQPPETAASSAAGSSASPSNSLVPFDSSDILIPVVTLHPAATPSPSLSLPSVSPGNLHGNLAQSPIVGTWINNTESITFYNDKTYQVFSDGIPFSSGTYTYNLFTGSGTMMYIGSTLSFTVEGDTLTIHKGYDIQYQRE